MIFTAWESLLVALLIVTVCALGVVLYLPKERKPKKKKHKKIDIHI